MSRLAPLLLMAGCAWTPVVHAYPSGLLIVRVDSRTLWQICPGKLDDAGKVLTNKAGCTVDGVVYLVNNCVGAQALPHELAHREGIKDPANEGYDW